MAAGPVDALTSPEGALALATAALLLVVGLRLAGPRGAAGWAGGGAYAASLAATLLGGLGVVPGPALAPPLALRLAGAAAVVAGLLVAGARARRAARAAGGAAAAAPSAWAGLALVLVGQLARAPSAAGALGLAAAAAGLGWAAASARRPAGAV